MTGKDDGGLAQAEAAELPYNPVSMFYDNIIILRFGKTFENGNTIGT